MTKKEFMQTCKATIPNGYFEKDDICHSLDFRYSYKPVCNIKTSWYYVAFWKNGRACICGCLPWHPEEDYIRVPTGDQETFALNLKDVIPPQEEM